jgi:hypothetical protein
MKVFHIIFCALIVGNWLLKDDCLELII